MNHLQAPQMTLTSWTVLSVRSHSQRHSLLKSLLLEASSPGVVQSIVAVCHQKICIGMVKFGESVEVSELGGSQQLLSRWPCLQMPGQPISLSIAFWRGGNRTCEIL